MEVGSRLRELREARGLSQSGLAESADVHRNTVGDIELGKASPTLHVMKKLAAALGVSVRDLVSDSEPVAAAS